MAAGTTTIQVTFSEPVLNGGVAANYELRRAETDGLLLDSDTVITPSGISYSGNTATLTFPALVEDVHRLTVKDTITDVAGNMLDGDSNSTAGGDWVRDFVVGALTHTLTSPGPNSYPFEIEYGGWGAGQLVQGAGGAFDGLNRLKVGGGDFNSSSTTSLGYTVHEVTSTVGAVAVVTVPVTKTLTVYPGLTQTITLTETKVVYLAARMGFLSTQLEPWPIEAGFRINGNYTPRTVPVQLAPQNYNHETAFFDHYLTLVPGTYTIEAMVRNPFGTGIYFKDTYLGAASGNSYTSLPEPDTFLRVVEMSPRYIPTVDDAGQTVVTNSHPSPASMSSEKSRSPIQADRISRGRSKCSPIRPATRSRRR